MLMREWQKYIIVHACVSIYMYIYHARQEYYIHCTRVYTRSTFRTCIYCTARTNGERESEVTCCLTLRVSFLTVGRNFTSHRPRKSERRLAGRCLGKRMTPYHHPWCTKRAKSRSLTQCLFFQYQLIHLHCSKWAKSGPDKYTLICILANF